MNSLHLVSSLSQLDLVPTRNGFGEGLLELGKTNPKVVALCADLTESTRVHHFATAFPERFFEMGITEQTMMAAGAGFAHCGKIPFVSSYAVFNPGRNWDHFRVSVCYPKANVKVIGAHAGISVGPDGATHQALEDIAITRVLPHLTVVVPCDALQAKRATLAIASHIGPCYLRLGRDKVPTLTTDKTPFTLGKAQVFKEGKDVVIFVCGALVYQALVAAEALSKKKISCAVINVHTIKPLDREAITLWAKKCKAVVTAEEHQIIGGLGGAIAEVLGETYPVPLERVGVKDSFGESGTPAELMKKYGLTFAHIIKAVQKVLKRK